MPRRTKLIITAILLVLLVVPAVYGLLMWSPKNPLAFRILSHHITSSGPNSGLFMEMEVTNASTTTIHSLSAELQASWKSDPSDATAESAFEDGMMMWGADAVLPNETRRCTAWIGGDGMELVNLKDAEIHYNFRSWLQYQAERLLYDLNTHLPEEAGRHLPRRFESHGAAKLEPPAS